MLSTSTVRAHAQLIRSDPADGILVATAPGKVTLTFSEPVRPLVARLVQPSGQIAVLKEIGEKGSNITLTLPDDLENGTYTLSWRVTSGDGHPIGGGLVFSVGASSGSTPVSVGESDPLIRVGLWATRLTFMLGLIIGVGGVGFYTLIGRYDPKAGEGIIPIALSAGLLSAPLLLGLQGLDSLGGPLSDLLTASVWTAGLYATSYGGSISIAATALTLAYAARLLKYTSRAGILLSLTALLLTGVASASAGHAATAPPRGLTTPAVFLHVVAVLLWMGSLIPLVVAFTRERAAAPRVLEQFSCTVPAIVAILGVSGLVLAVVQVRTVSALWTTDYGVVLLIKLMLVASILFLALFNRYWLTEPAIADDRRATRRLIRSTSTEIALGSVVIAVLGLWRFTPPPRAMLVAPAIATVQEAKVSKDGVSATLIVRPPRVGPVSVEVSEIRVDGQAVEPLSVKIELDKPSYGIGPFMREARQQEALYHGDGFVLPLDGFWIVRVTVLITEFRSVTLTDVFDIAKGIS
ncbi:copper resistance CopC/CopD family protein [Microvirga zambiensis]|uniref:copper resistance CopC/CopD family protein n=1 Tax=Microvirga zambiensis TaxID=1402137 RepID=UPI00191EF4CA|nr:copper resistance protein CopC [Microvirga zambiensis]